MSEERGRYAGDELPVDLWREPAPETRRPYLPTFRVRAGESYDDYTALSARAWFAALHWLDGRSYYCRGKDVPCKGCEQSDRPPTVYGYLAARSMRRRQAGLLEVTEYTARYEAALRPGLVDLRGLRLHCWRHRCQPRGGVRLRIGDRDLPADECPAIDVPSELLHIWHAPARALPWAQVEASLSFGGAQP